MRTRLFEPGNGLGEKVRLPFIIVVMNAEVRTAGGIDPGVEGHLHPEAFSGVQNGEAFTVRREHLFDELVHGGAIPAVVDDNQLPVGEGLAANGGQRATQKRGPVFRPGDNGDGPVRNFAHATWISRSTEGLT